MRSLPSRSALALAVAATSGAPEAARAAASSFDTQRTSAVSWSVQHAGQVISLVTNWGQIGSTPGTAAPYAGEPSARWPRGSDTDYLWAGGPWVGALLNGEPHVTTASYAVEFSPGPAAIDRIYETRAGATGGNRAPSPDADDDRDGRVDEDRLDGRDNDLDGRIDEDFAAISDQMLACRFDDVDPSIRDRLPEHVPLGLEVQQSTLAWARPELDDFIGIEYRIENRGLDPLEDVHVGFFADCDIGPRGALEISEDDRGGFWEGTVVTSLEGREESVEVSLGYMHDADGDGGASPGFIGFLFLGAAGPDASERDVQLRNFRISTGAASYEQGGDPAVDAERYAVLAGTAPLSIPPPGGGPRPPLLVERNRDWRITISIGPLGDVAPGEAVQVAMAMVLGAGFDEMLQNAARARLLYEGVRVDCDGDPRTPEQCRVRWTTPGTVPILVARLNVLRDGRGARLEWQIPDLAVGALQGVDVQRAPAPAGPYATVNAGALSPAPRMSFADPGGRPGAWYRLALRSHDGAMSFTAPVPFDPGTARTWRTALEVPEASGPDVHLRYTIGASTGARLAAYDVRGRLVRLLRDERLDPGAYFQVWDRRDARGAHLPRGVYVLRLEAGGDASSRKLVIARD